MVLINGQFPGPLIEANWGDTISVTVHNRLNDPEDGTSLHWHGFLQKDTPYYDGVPSVQQCPITPGGDFIYRFKAELYGTTWYHAHYGAQYMDGPFGPITIYGYFLIQSMH
jgi:FtsP/CotA-like multicopper oxidase with cupredoxin domain